MTEKRELFDIKEFERLIERHAFGSVKELINSEISRNVREFAEKVRETAKETSEYGLHEALENMIDEELERYK